MSYFEYPFPSNDLINSGRLDSDPFNNYPTLNVTELETEDPSFYDLLGMSEKSFNIEDMMIQSKMDTVPVDYLTQTDSGKQRRHMFKRETFTPELDEAELCLPSTITDASDYAAILDHSAYPMDASSPAGMSSTSSTSNVTQRGKLKSAKAMDKNSEEYLRRRQLNNIAVKKSREKAKAESRLIAQRVTVLSVDKERLERRVEMLGKEVQILHSLFAKMSNIPDTVRAEVARSVARIQSQPR